MKKITLILPVYNVEKYLDYCIQSILEQTYPNFELLIVNDGSTDTSGQISDRYAAKDKRVRVIHQKNQGLSMARNRGLAEAQSKYISFIDSDDAIHSKLLETLYQNLKNYEADISVIDYQLIDDDDNDVKNFQLPYENKTQVLDNMAAVDQIIVQSETQMIIAWGKLYKKTLFENVQYPPGKYHEDEFVTYQLFYQAERTVVSNAKLYFYRQRGDSITGARYELKRLDKLVGLKEAIDFFEKEQQPALAQKARARYLLNIQIAYYKVKFEMKNEEKVLQALSTEYKKEYQLLKKERSDHSFFQSFSLAFFNLTPTIYSWLVHVYLRLKR